MTYLERQAIEKVPALEKRIEALEARLAEIEKQRPTLTLKENKRHG